MDERRKRIILLSLTGVLFAGAGVFLFRDTLFGGPEDPLVGEGEEAFNEVMSGYEQSSNEDEDDAEPVEPGSGRLPIGDGG